MLTDIKPPDCYGLSASVYIVTGQTVFCEARLLFFKRLNSYCASTGRLKREALQRWLKHKRMYRSLDSEKIITTIETLRRRIGERFPDSGLSKVCRELLTIAQESHERSAWIAKPQRALRFIIGVLIVVIILSLISIFASLTLPRGGFDVVGFVQVSESAMNILILVGATILFLMTLESRIKRSRALKAIHELRALAHVIDMHQLTKAPDRILIKGQQTPSSPKESLSAFELVRYLDYCSEMLSLTGKIAALYVQKFSDPVALTAVEEVEELTTGLTRKIWQKIMILNFLMTRDKDQAPGEGFPM